VALCPRCHTRESLAEGKWLRAHINPARVGPTGEYLATAACPCADSILGGTPTHTQRRSYLILSCSSRTTNVYIVPSKQTKLTNKLSTRHTTFHIPHTQTHYPTDSIEYSPLRHTSMSHQSLEWNHLVCTLVASICAAVAACTGGEYQVIADPTPQDTSRTSTSSEK